MQKKKWLVPPGLFLEVENFQHLFAETKSVPLMIHGPSGVGKSLFVHLYKCLFQREHPRKNQVTLNCAAFSKDLLLSELFGHVKGAFTGATKDKTGHIGQANGGLLILEEIGELPPEGQAQLLTFIEDGYFFKVGSTNREHASIQIICTTNKPMDSFREDFWYRFFPYRIKPIYERREDILYYLAWSDPEIINELMPWEVLSLLCYNWPGNVREIERVVRLLRWRKKTTNDGSINYLNHSLIKSMRGDRSEYTALDPYNVFWLRNSLRDSGVDIRQLERDLKKFRLSLSPETNKDPAFKISRSEQGSHLSHPEIDRLYSNKEGEVKTCSDARYGRWSIDRTSVEGLQFFTKFLRIPLGWLSDRDLIKVALEKMEPRKGEDDDLDPTFDENEKRYLSRMLKRAGGNISAAARLTGLKRSTLDRKLKIHRIR